MWADLAGFQLNERYLNWDVAAQTQLLKLACADRLGLVSSKNTSDLAFASSFHCKIEPISAAASRNIKSNVTLVTAGNACSLISPDLFRHSY